MQLRYGRTRLVVLVGNMAIKIGRIRPLCSLVRTMILPFSKKGRERYQSKYGYNFFQAICNDVFAGIIANRHEYSYSQRRPEDVRVIPTIRQYLGGLVVVQIRCVEVTEQELTDESPFKLRLIESCWEISTPTQFGRNPLGQLVLIDYGRKQTVQMLYQTYKALRLKFDTSYLSYPKRARPHDA